MQFSHGLYTVLKSREAGFIYWSQSTNQRPSVLLTSFFSACRMRVFSWPRLALMRARLLFSMMGLDWRRNTLCSLSVHSLFTLCSLCSLSVHYLFTLCSLSVHYLFTFCSLSVNYPQRKDETLSMMESNLLTLC